MAGRVDVKVDLRALKRLVSQPQAVLKELDMPCRDEMRRTLDFAAFLVPQGPNLGDTSEPPLHTTGFLSGPLYNLEVLSTTWFSGYNHPAAGAIHEGFHWGLETENPRPRWMAAAFKGAKGRARKSVAKAMEKALRRFFPAS